MQALCTSVCVCVCARVRENYKLSSSLGVGTPCYYLLLVERMYMAGIIHDTHQYMYRTHIHTK